MDVIKARFSGALGVSAVLHFGLALIVVVLWSVYGGGQVQMSPQPPKLQVYYVTGAAGGGGGNPADASPRVVQVPPHELPHVSLVAPLDPVVEPPKQTLDALVRTDAASQLQFSGAGVQLTDAPGGNGLGPGAGPDNGPGLGPGRGGETGGGPRRAGGDVLPPVLLRSVEPRYTGEAMMAKIQGSVELEAVVLANGTVGDLRVKRSLDRVRGLDVEAIRAAKQWIFRPGTQGGRPVDVIVTLILEFTIH